ncbi:MAG: hypothetical protein GEU90_18330 [Gemmatimonas sp.]|nr:hypothetical protein [Gemmatimonas sp.]
MTRNRAVTRGRRLVECSIAFTIALPALAGCDPCFGVSSCGGAVISYGGAVYDTYPDAPAVGREIMMVWKSGVELAEDSVRFVTGSDGHFTLRVPALSMGEVIADFVVNPSVPDSSHLVRDQVLKTTRGNNVLPLEPWVSIPPITYVGELYYRGNLARVADATVEFRRTRGIAVRPDTFTVLSNFEGRFWLIPTPLQGGTVYGEMYVTLEGVAQSFLVPEFPLETFQGGQVRILRRGIGPNWDYVGELRWADRNEPAVGVQVDFVPTGGLELIPGSRSTTTNGDGQFRVPGRLLDPLLEGIVEGDLIFHRSEGSPVTVTGLEFPTYEGDPQLPAGEWTIERP